MLWALFRNGELINLSGVFRNKKRENPFVQIDKNMITDEKISWKAKGILAYLLSKPDGWVTYATDIEKRSTDGRESVASGIKELIAAGYMEREQVREKGRFKGYAYSVYEYPKVIDSTENGFPENGLPEDGKPATSNNDLSNKDFKNNNDNAGEQKDIVETPFSFYENNGFGILAPHVGQKIGAWIDDTNEELVIHAMKMSLENGFAKWSYTEAILKDWHQKKISNVSDVLAAEEQRRRQIEELKKRPRYGPKTKEETIPEWLKENKLQNRPFTPPSEELDIAEERRKLLEELGMPEEKDEGEAE